MTVVQRDIQKTLYYVEHPDKHKGYKGIGRLCGLGYCTQLVFTSCVKGETVESILTYDAAKWRQMINAHINHEKQYTALEVLRETATFSRREIESAEFSFFRVELIGITKDNKDLLDKARVEEYLSFVAPVPYRNVFQLRTKIYEHAQNLGLRIDEYNVFYDGEPIYKEYKPTVVTSKGEDTIDDIGFHDIYYGDKLIAWMWYGITKFQAVLKPENKERSIRLRQNNIQVGIPDVLHEHAPFSEERGPHYFVGELFVVDTSLRLNAPRSYFEESPIRNELEQQLKFYFDINLTTIYKK